MKPKWDEIENVRKKSHDFLVSHGLENDSVHAFTMVIRELIENSVKYGKGPIKAK
jgi:two-component sensor histidine kinase